MFFCDGKFGPFEEFAVGRHEFAVGAVGRDEFFVFEAFVGFLDGVGIYLCFGGEFANRGELCSRSESARDNPKFQLFS